MCVCLLLQDLCVFVYERCVRVCLLLQDLVQSCLRGVGGIFEYRRTCATRDVVRLFRPLYHTGGSSIKKNYKGHSQDPPTLVVKCKETLSRGYGAMLLKKSAAGLDYLKCNVSKFSEATLAGARRPGAGARGHGVEKQIDLGPRAGMPRRLEVCDGRPHRLHVLWRARSCSIRALLTQPRCRSGTAPHCFGRQGVSSVFRA
jgi:hypothetical protein